MGVLWSYIACGTLTLVVGVFTRAPAVAVVRWSCVIAFACLFVFGIGRE